MLDFIFRILKAFICYPHSQTFISMRLCTETLVNKQQFQTVKVEVVRVRLIVSLGSKIAHSPKTDLLISAYY